MKKLILLLAMCLSTYNVFAQESKHAFSFYAAPTYTNRILINKDNTSSTNEYINGVWNSENGVYNYALGLDYSYRLGRRFILEAGLWQRQMSSERFEYMIFIETSPYANRERYISQQTGLSLGAQYEWLKRGRWSCSAGLAANGYYVYGTRINRTYYHNHQVDTHEKVDDYRGLNTWQVEGTVSAACHYHFNAQWSIYAQPFYSIGGTSLVKSDSYSALPTCMGLRVGATYKL